MESSLLDKKLRIILPEIKERYQIEKLGYFGSYAKGEQTSASDVDILVYFKKPLGWDFFELKNILEERLSMNIDLVSYNALIPSLKNEILESTKFID
ncbi:nucleotidyltransferase family protein [Fulvivirga lutea]|uniref:Nucleotidyltransferase family protein n=1 Tax=Fulvivirga lutea TaxID=2810512 RepID=A0A974WM63_9BACT|nr:nucleotidyltransferase family protein [Fulvivirga lutea]QSE97968.1 nucleotidyltransferase family protein [Fulvivirga lutea]